MKRLFLLLSILIMTACGTADAGTNAQSISFLLSQVRTSTTSLAGGEVYFYAAGTTTPQSVWLDSGKVTQAANPYTLDANGTAQLYGDGIYRVVIKDAAGSTKFDRDNLEFSKLANVTFANVIDYGGGTLAEAVTSIGSTPTTLVYGTDQTLSTGLTVPSTLELMPINGAVINHGAYTISYAGSTARWPQSRIFNGTGAVTLAGAEKVLPQYFQDTSLSNWNASFQAAINTAAANSLLCFIPSGDYVITDALTMPQQTRIQGEHAVMASTGGTKILFQPTSLKTLFAPATGTALQDGYSIEGLVIIGNSTDAAGYSFRAIDCVDIINSSFKNMRIMGFLTGIHCESTINNRFEQVHISNCYLHCVFYTGGLATTDVWDQCYFVNAPIGIQTSGTSLEVRFINCLFESIGTYGVNLVKECYGFSFINCRSEDVPNLNVATNAMFRIGFDGASLQTSHQLSIMGGYYGGNNGGGLYGSFLTTDSIDSVILGGFGVTRYNNVVLTSANTQTNKIVAGGWVSQGVSAQVSDPTKVSGFYPVSTLDSGTRNVQSANFGLMTINNVILNSGAAATTGGLLELGNGTETTVGAAGGATALPATPLGYLMAYLGTQKIKIPYYLP